jgi:hypothetical protein
MTRRLATSSDVSGRALVVAPALLGVQGRAYRLAGGTKRVLFYLSERIFSGDDVRPAAIAPG